MWPNIGLEEVDAASVLDVFEWDGCTEPQAEHEGFAEEAGAVEPFGGARGTPLARDTANVRARVLDVGAPISCPI